MCLILLQFRLCSFCCVAGHTSVPGFLLYLWVVQSYYSSSILSAILLLLVPLCRPLLSPVLPSGIPAAFFFVPRMSPILKYHQPGPFDHPLLTVDHPHPAIAGIRVRPSHVAFLASASRAAVMYKHCISSSHCMEFME